jgi:chromosome segregation ATPase
MKQSKRNLQLALVSLLAQGTTPGETTTTSTEEEDDKPTGRLDEIKKRAKNSLAEDRAALKEQRKADARKKACEAREKNLNNKIKNFGNHAQRHLDRLDKTYDKLQAYQEQNKLDADKYDALVVIADEKQTTATEAVAALKEVVIDIDCTATDPAESVATVKEAVKNARVSLQEYHTAVKDVLVELMTSKSDSKADDDSSTDTGDDTKPEETTGGTN